MKIDLTISKNILFYTDVVDLLQDHAPEFIDGLSRVDCIKLAHMHDFQDLAFCVVDYETVLVLSKSGGDVYAKYTMQEFLDETMKEINEYEF